jgi:hypothetical protein
MSDVLNPAPFAGRLHALPSLLAGGVPPLRPALSLLAQIAAALEARGQGGGSVGVDQVMVDEDGEVQVLGDLPGGASAISSLVMLILWWIPRAAPGGGQIPEIARGGAQLREMVHAALGADPGKRPTLGQLQAVLRSAEGRCSGASLVAWVEAITVPDSPSEESTEPIAPVELRPAVHSLNLAPQVPAAAVVASTVVDAPAPAVDAAVIDAPAPAADIVADAAAPAQVADAEVSVQAAITDAVDAPAQAADAADAADAAAGQADASPRHEKHARKHTAMGRAKLRSETKGRVGNRRDFKKRTQSGN